MRFLFACGGTAGHIYPALAVAGRLKELMPDCEILFVGAEGKMECELVPREGFAIDTLQVTNLRRSVSFAGLRHNLGTVKNLLFAMGAAKRILREFQPDVAVGTGGYVCYPVLKQAAKMGIPTAIHESNAVPGLTTKRLAQVVDRVMLGLADAKAAYPKSVSVTHTGTPVRAECLNLNKAAARRELGLRAEDALVLSFWGSLGATGMNERMVDFIRMNHTNGRFRHIHATGGGEVVCEKLKAALAAKGVALTADGNTDLRPYIYDMPRVMAAADVILCRAGASTIAELSAMGKPVVLVPSPYVTGNHQEENAKILEKNGGAILRREADCTGEGLYQVVAALLADPDRLQAMEAAMRGMGTPRATDKITGIILDMVK